MARTLLITAGETPQVVTETLWALAQPPANWRPDRICLATTASGERLYREGRGGDRPVAPLLGPGGRLEALCARLWPGQPLPDVHLLVAEADGRPLPDLRTAEEVERFAEMLLAEVAAVTMEPGSQLHLSLAGGRKTMSFLAGQVMSLLGRAQDRLSHVLVEPAALEREPGFWWPGDGSPGADRAIIRLHEVPFLRVRAWLDPERGLDLTSGFRAVVERANRELAADQLLLDLVARRIEVAGQAIALTPREMALMALVAIARLRAVPLERVELGRDTENRPVNGIALGGSAEDARQLWGWLIDAARGPGKPAASPRFESARDEALSSFNYAIDIGEPASRIRRALRGKLAGPAAMRVLAPKALCTQFPPEAIAILAPPELADDPDRPPEIQFPQMAVGRQTASA